MRETVISRSRSDYAVLAIAKWLLLVLKSAEIETENGRFSDVAL